MRRIEIWEISQICFGIVITSSSYLGRKEEAQAKLLDRHKIMAASYGSTLAPKIFYKRKLLKKINNLSNFVRRTAVFFFFFFNRNNYSKMMQQLRDIRLKHLNIRENPTTYELLFKRERGKKNLPITSTYNFEEIIYSIEIVFEKSSWCIIFEANWNLYLPMLHNYAIQYRLNHKFWEKNFIHDKALHYNNRLVFHTMYHFVTINVSPLAGPTRG